MPRTNIKSSDLIQHFQVEKLNAKSMARPISGMDWYKIHNVKYDILNPVVNICHYSRYFYCTDQVNMYGR